MDDAQTAEPVPHGLKAHLEQPDFHTLHLSHLKLSSLILIISLTSTWTPRLRQAFPLTTTTFHRSSLFELDKVVATCMVLNPTGLSIFPLYTFLVGPDKDLLSSRCAAYLKRFRY